ncbi:hypothetical protein CAC42_1329 [Sphaceloma murrayae]|uniref:Uncharacterized protein n=1 Tax=Sphaceloma murrayae TaxID=2082308 RepID=A0A2K1QFI4_9PEZI|nr:hypothetical protein CAC42_1329 [Sphaceloma murrayae]
MKMLALMHTIFQQDRPRSQSLQQDPLGMLDQHPVFDLPLESQDAGRQWTVIRKEASPSFGRVPSNTLSRIISRFASNLDSDKNSNFQLPWNFGPFLEDVPRRLGRNAALDASAEAVMAAYVAFRTRGGGDPDRNDALCLNSYGRAVNALRACLNDDRASSSETLCSTLMLLIVETLSGLDKGKILSHAGGAAGILKARGAVKSKNEFEDKILLSLRGPVIMHALFTQEPIFTNREWEALVINPMEGHGVDGRVLRVAALLPNLLLNTRSAFAQSRIDYVKLIDVHGHLRELHTAHALSRREVVARFEEIDTREASTSALPVQTMIFHSHYARQVAVTLAYEIMLCLLLSTICSAPPPPHLMDSDGFPWSPTVDPFIYLDQVGASSKYLSDLGDRVTAHRPLGTIYMTFVLRVAHVAAPTETAKARIIAQLHDFASDMGVPTAKIDSELQQLGEYLTLRDVRGWRPGKVHPEEAPTGSSNGRYQDPGGYRESAKVVPEASS